MTFMHHRPAMTYSPEGTEQFPDPEVPETTTPPIKNPEAETAADRSDVLARICARTRVDIEQRSQIMSLKDITARAREVTTPTRGFGQALQHLTADRQVGLIAEIKKASPSAGSCVRTTIQ